MKSWFQHDINASKKQGLSLLLSLPDGVEYYGRFWLLQEHFYLIQQHKNELSETVKINENSLMRVLKCNRRNLGKVLETFRKRLGIVSETFGEPFGNVWEITIPNALIYISVRKVKSINRTRTRIKYNSLKNNQLKSDNLEHFEPSSEQDRKEREEAAKIAGDFARQLKKGELTLVKI